MFGILGAMAGLPPPPVSATVLLYWIPCASRGKVMLLVNLLPFLLLQVRCYPECTAELRVPNKRTATEGRTRSRQWFSCVVFEDIFLIFYGCPRLFILENYRNVGYDTIQSITSLLNFTDSHISLSNETCGNVAWTVVSFERLYWRNICPRCPYGHCEGKEGHSLERMPLTTHRQNSTNENIVLHFPAGITITLKCHFEDQFSLSLYVHVRSCSSDTVSVYRIPMSETLDTDKSPRKNQITMIVRYSACEQ